MLPVAARLQWQLSSRLTLATQMQRPSLAVLRLATVEMIGGGTAKASSKGMNATAVSTVDEACKADSTAKGANSTAVAVCENSSSVVTAEATNGSTAVGSDTAPPMCTHAPGGIARVKSPMGNCP
jgi:uncharacterized protein YwlG (UPF0340 family)